MYAALTFVVLLQEVYQILCFALSAPQQPSRRSYPRSCQTINPMQTSVLGLTIQGKIST